MQEGRRNNCCHRRSRNKAINLEDVRQHICLREQDSFECTFQANAEERNRYNGKIITKARG